MKAKQIKRTTARVSRNKTMPSTLGATPIYVRSFQCVGGVRPGCKFTKKKNNKARRAGYPDFQSMMASLSKVAGMAARRMSPTAGE